MNSTYRVSVLKQLSAQFTRNDKLRIQTLFFDVNHTWAQICLETDYIYDQVYYTITHHLTSQKRKTKKRILLNIFQRKRLIQWVTASWENRETSWFEISQILDFDCDKYVIRSAFKKKEFERRVE